MASEGLQANTMLTLSVKREDLKLTGFCESVQCAQNHGILFEDSSKSINAAGKQQML